MRHAPSWNLSDGLSDGLDKQVLAGTNGLLAGTRISVESQRIRRNQQFDGYISGFGYGSG